MFFLLVEEPRQPETKTAKNYTLIVACIGPEIATPYPTWDECGKRSTLNLRCRTQANDRSDISWKRNVLTGGVH